MNTQQIKTTLNKPENMKKVKRFPIAFGFGLIGFMTSLVFITSGIHILIQTGVPEKLITQFLGALLIVCGFGCAKNVMPGITKIMMK